MNWGYKIVFAFSVFVVFIVFLVVKSFQQNIDLVAEDYYKQEIQYQQQIDKINNSHALNERITFIQENQQLMVQFPEELNHQLEGEINLFRPSDARFDVNTKIAVDSKLRQWIPTSDLLKGYYKVKVDWTDGVKDYYVEESLYIK
ncbi:hypothetical protein OKW21_001258 [Catalinimonas alkaloidigena]|uniref:FixH family protein n=1 Tax=Catalinimonas alkaloidigena TaxID=1075417 RepID=UPI002405A2EF|nr:FixH family protein [Catalinimonas alkaloidigena]MDF9795995.1 hypothetical protein [Catalinimonas alkaloidigena]